MTVDDELREPAIDERGRGDLDDSVDAIVLDQKVVDFPSPMTVGSGLN